MNLSCLVKHFHIKNGSYVLMGKQENGGKTMYLYKAIHMFSRNLMK